ncbi:MAG TPA: class I SAM-dependent methyltransferase [Candidatus Eisenbergiella stercorigallinarum]|uniref:Class I SAM-dependent methyltransferase n=2 Tax=Eisenbergiella TaxID=1432051 RepID=A0A9D2R2K6_9FIRM|nr:class I SAM-dependent methyltransferase [Candidatus Eisenbergiella pullistercoris]HJD32722.1 class I SAM-dependent methyltransferase [Candidatus Eisenbergiella stercorigallinarum]
MEAYTDFAEVYDTFMDNVPYEKWADYIADRLGRAGIRDGLVLELGCGTGTLTQLLARRGYDMIGVDRSEEMLAVAAQKAAEEGLDILYLEQDMQSFELYGTVRAAVCVCDSLNYLLGEEQLRETFRLVNNYLDPGGVFLFDFNTVYKYEKILGDVTIAENREDCAFIWENFYDEETRINEYDLTFFVREKDGAQGGLFRRFLETHCQRGYELSEIRALLEEGGLRFEEALDADTLGEVTPESGRIYCIAREQGK